MICTSPMTASAPGPDEAPARDAATDAATTETTTAVVVPAICCTVRGSRSARLPVEAFAKVEVEFAPFVAFGDGVVAGAEVVVGAEVDGVD